MCGITGKMYFAPFRQVDERLLQEMTDTLMHRGPDESGYFADGSLGLGVRRLSIIDLQTGHQPVFNEDESKVIVFNGEIYNFQAITSDLSARGHRFRTAGDTEAILHAYEEYGPDCVHHLNGMFAFAIYDRKRRSLFLARDRLGIKPLYYYRAADQFAFASEIKAIIADPDIPRQVDETALDLYLKFLYVPAPWSMFKGIRKLPPGHYAIVSADDFILRQYWDIPCEPDNTHTEHELIPRFQELFEDAVRIRMISDVPLGAFLSGGIDSSSIVAAMCKTSSQPVKTFSIGFQEGGYHDESSYAQRVAEHFHTEHTTLYVDADMLDLLPEYVHHFDEPFGDYAAFPTYVLSRLAQKQVKVILTGDGSDELFAGYERYASEQLAMYYALLPAWMRNRAIAPLLRALQHTVPQDRRLAHFVRDAIKKTDLLNLNADDRYITSFHKFPDALRMALYIRRPQLDAHPMHHYWHRIHGNDILAHQLYLDQKTSLPDDMLTKVDRVTMAASLEARVPFLDHRLVELAARISSSMKLRPWHLKRFVKRAMRDELPRSVVRRRKHGFSAPMDRWLRYDLKTLLCDTLSPEALRRHYLFHADTVHTLIRTHLEGRANYGVQLFMLMVFQMWYERYISDFKSERQKIYEESFGNRHL